jgi:hypothetical protein
MYSGDHEYDACDVTLSVYPWIYTQSNIRSIIFTSVHYTNTEKIMIIRLHSLRRRRWVKLWDGKLRLNLPSQSFTYRPKVSPTVCDAGYRLH